MGMAVGTRELKYWVLGPSGFGLFGASRLESQEVLPASKLPQVVPASHVNSERLSDLSLNWAVFYPETHVVRFWLRPVSLFGIKPLPKKVLHKSFWLWPVFFLKG